jgi:hypothetical protein
MSEVDIWIKVLDKLEFKFIDEFCGPGDINYIKYRHNEIEYSLYFNRKTKVVNSLFTFSINSTTKQLFYNQYIDIFRDIKLESLT